VVIIFAFLDLGKKYLILRQPPRCLSLKVSLSHMWIQGYFSKIEVLFLKKGDQKNGNIEGRSHKRDL